MSRESRREFIKKLGAGSALAGIGPLAQAQDRDRIGFFGRRESKETNELEWEPISDRKIRVGIVGYGASRFGAAFGFQSHPNVEVVAVSDLIPDRRAALARDCECETTYTSLEQLVKDPSIEAVFVATDAPSHAQHCIDVVEHGKHVACAVPAVFGNVEEADRLYDAVKQSGMLYMMFETSYFRPDNYAMRQLYTHGVMGDVVYAEGEYYHFIPEPIRSFNGWRDGLPPQYYPTHSNAYLTGVSGESFTEVSCMGMPSKIKEFIPENNRYKNPFGTEIALYRNSGGGMSRMAVSWDTPGYNGEVGRVRGRNGSMIRSDFQGDSTRPKDINLHRGPLPNTVIYGGHGGAHGYLCDEFISAILQERTPLCHIAEALNMSVSGIVAHESALRDGELLKIPQWTL